MMIAAGTSCGSLRAVKCGVCLVLSVVVACGGGRPGSQPDAQSGDAGAEQPDAGTPANACSTTLGFPNVPAVVAKSSMYAFATADFDGDGKLDVAFPDDEAVRVAKGKGNGTYETPIAIATNADANLVNTIAVGDVSGDGKVDIIYGGFGTSLRVLTNSGGLTFAAPVTYDMTVLPYEVELRDMNSDGRLDIVALDRNSDKFSIRLATSTGLASAVTYSSSTIVETSVHFVLGDINGDTKPDAVVATGRADGFYTLLNNGSGGFGAPTLHATAGPPYDVALGDVNGDGAADVLLTHDDQGYVRVLLNNGTGGFGNEMTASLGAFLRSPYIALGDIDADQHVDAVVASSDDPAGLVLLLGTGTGTFGTPIAIGAPPATQVELIDTNGDGKLDILAAGNRKISTWLRSTSASGYDARSLYRFATGDRYVASARLLEIDSTPGPELVTAYWREEATNGALAIRSDIGGSYDGPGSSIATQGLPRRTLTADVDGDMRTDLIVFGDTDDATTGQVFLNRNGTLTAAPAFPAITYWRLLQTYAVDVNEDGKLDLVLASLASVALLLGNGDGSFGAATPLWSSSVAALRGCVVGDFDRDGHVDFVVETTMPALEFHKGIGNGSFADAVVGTATKPSLLDARDLDRDGRLDLIEQGNDWLAVRLGHGDGTFGDRVESDVLAGEESAYADVNGDGHLDVLTLTAYNNALAVLLGKGDGTLQPALHFEAGSRPATLAIADIDGDGRVDVVTNSNAENRVADVSVLFGRCLP